MTETKAKITRFKDIPQFTSSGSYQVNYPLTSLVREIEEEVSEMGLHLNPEFQRGHVWTEEQQIAWLEYHLRGGKSGNTIYLNNPFWNSYREPKQNEYSDYVCVDGLQRITAAQRFVHNEIKVFGSYFKEYEDRLKWNIYDRVKYRNIISLADTVKLVSDEEYKPYLMQKRNEYMVDHSDKVIAVWDGSKSGTKNCIDYAKKVGKDIIFVQP